MDNASTIESKAKLKTPLFQKIALFVVVLAFSSSLNAADDTFLSVEEVRFDESISFPFIVANRPEKLELANQINKNLQEILFDGEELINKDNLELIESHIYLQDDSINQSGISYLSYNYVLHTHFLIITMEIEWSGGPYPIPMQTDFLHFDLETGKLAQMPDLIDGAKYFDFLERFWLGDCRNSIKNMHQCAYGNETDDYESEKAFSLDGECEFQCHKMNHQFLLAEDSIYISNNSNCFPHVWQNCNEGTSKHLKIKDIKDYLSDYGKWILGLNDNYSEVNPYYHFVGKIDDKYKLSMTLVMRKDKFEGAYFYWNQNKKIQLKGHLNAESNKIILTESADNAQTGSFELEWDDFLYSTEGFWYSASKKKKLTVDLFNIYDYISREYYR